jgi:hypothetical protein
MPGGGGFYLPSASGNIQVGAGFGGSGFFGGGSPGYFVNGNGTAGQGYGGGGAGGGTTGATGNAAGGNGAAGVCIVTEYIGATAVSGMRSYLAGLQTTYNATTSIGVAAGMAADSSNSLWIALGATYYKSVSSAWAAGAGSSGAPVGGMGAGLTVAASTTYHVFAIINGGNSDIYFDTSPTAANAPAGTTAFRRILSIRTNASSQIIPYTQNGDEVLYNSVIPNDYSQSGVTANTQTSFALTVPTGINVWAIFSFMLNFPSGSGTQTARISAVGQGGSMGYTQIASQTASTWVGTFVKMRTNTSAQCQVIGTVAMNCGADTYGYIDRRGRDA